MVWGKCQLDLACNRSASGQHGLLVASHSVQGPRLGIPQMIQSRAQFGVLGAIFPMLFVMFIYFGFSVSNTLLAAQTVNGVVAVAMSRCLINGRKVACR
ncbi:cytosine permease [Rhizobium ruizarguesonis]